ncbi:MAG TPA: Na/Pi cotransporter family protein [Quisquiliibacterium sp.]|nr:Na/Pi cotransporter family protein [Quisquiliibacterium sp.]
MWGLIAGLAGGVGLFLLGMSMMTDGLRVAAGPALERILAGATRTRWHALGSGILVTAMVQSSTAVTVAAIGFVNAGMLGLAPALWVLFGSNVGTTMTGWIVALVGLKFKIEALALPLIGLGVVLRLTGAGLRRGELGGALAGFGLLFLGISMLQEAFTDLATRMNIPHGDGPLAVLAQVIAGAVMTVLMQSSSASITIAITAAQGGLLTPQSAAAVVIGANIGTTLTAIIAAIGATSNARRAAAAHVAFNLITGAVALALLPWLVGSIATLRASLGLAPDPAARLAAFHTIFNVLGVVLMWPLAGSLTRWLQRRFREREEDEAQPRYLDETVVAVPSLAVDAFGREVARIGHVATRMARTALSGADARALQVDQGVVGKLVTAGEAFVERVSRSAMSRRDSERLARVLRLQRYHEAVAEQSLAMAPLALPRVHDQFLVDLHAELLRCADRLFALCDPMAEGTEDAAVDEAAVGLERAYQALKAALLDSGATGSARLTEMDDALRRYSALRRAAQQATKAWEHRVELQTNHQPAGDDDTDAPQPAGEEPTLR